MPKIIDHDQRRRDIIEVATGIILRGGFEAATMRSIAAEAGFANGALKHYFDGKDSIVAATFESILTQLSEAVNAADSGDIRVRLVDFLRAPVPRDRDQIAAGRVLLALWEYAMTNDELAGLYRQHLEAWHENFTTILAEAHAAGVIAPAPPYDRLADEYISATIGAAVINLMYPDGERIADSLAYVDGFLERLGVVVSSEAPAVR